MTSLFILVHIYVILDVERCCWTIVFLDPELKKVREKRYRGKGWQAGDKKKDKRGGRRQQGICERRLALAYNALARPEICLFYAGVLLSYSAFARACRLSAFE